MQNACYTEEKIERTKKKTKHRKDITSYPPNPTMNPGSVPVPTDLFDPPAKITP